MTIYSLLLAGGKSSRMGQDKRFLVFEGQTLVERSLALLKSTGSDQILISGELAGYKSIPDLLPECGPLGGLHATLHHIELESGLNHEGNDEESDLLLVIPVDMPFLNKQCLETLLAGIGEADACFYSGEVFPCVFRLTSTLRSYLDSLFSQSRELGGNRSMKALLRHFSSEALVPEDFSDKVFINLNNPEDLELFLSVSE